MIVAASLDHQAEYEVDTCRSYEDKEKMAAAPEIEEVAEKEQDEVAVPASGQVIDSQDSRKKYKQKYLTWEDHEESALSTCIPLQR